MQPQGTVTHPVTRFRNLLDEEASAAGELPAPDADVDAVLLDEGAGVGGVDHGGVTVDPPDVHADMVDVAGRGREEDEVTWSELGHRGDPGADSGAGLRGAGVAGVPAASAWASASRGISTPMEAYSSWV